MSLNENICNAFAQFLRDRDLDVVEVVDWEERTVYDGYCETCYYEYVVVDIEYRDSEGTVKTYTYDGTFSSLMREL